MLLMMSVGLNLYSIYVLFSLIFFQYEFYELTEIILHLLFYILTFAYLLDWYIF
jgi:hypothetical protein